VAAVVQLRRYPVKSMTGEIVEHLDIEPRGCAGDRVWSVRAAGRIATAKTSSNSFAPVPGLLELRSAWRDGRVAVLFPDGDAVLVDEPAAAAKLSDHFGRPLTFSRETERPHFDDGPVSLVGATTVDAVAGELGEPVEPVRFRPNILFAGGAPFAEDSWVGREVAVGDAVLRVTMESPRCVMVDLATADLPALEGLLLATGRINHACTGVIAEVVRPGRVRVGDELTAV
jgi:MOSC domain-containing protein